MYLIGSTCLGYWSFRIWHFALEGYWSLKATFAGLIDAFSQYHFGCCSLVDENRIRELVLRLSFGAGDHCCPLILTISWCFLWIFVTFLKVNFPTAYTLYVLQHRRYLVGNFFPNIFVVSLYILRSFTIYHLWPH